MGVEAATIRATQAGVRHALAAIVDDFMPTVLGAAYGLCGDWDVGGDVAQETLATLVQRLGELREPEALPGWLMRGYDDIARRLVAAGASSAIVAASAGTDVPFRATGIKALDLYCPLPSAGSST